MLHRRGLRFRKHAAIDGGARTVRPDIVFTRRRVAIFVDGCFWHGCPDHSNQPIANAGYWAKKLERNRERDSQTTDMLHRCGWHVIRVWEHTDPEEAADLIEVCVRSK